MAGESNKSCFCFVRCSRSFPHRYLMTPKRHHTDWPYSSCFEILLACTTTVYHAAPHIVGPCKGRRGFFSLGENILPVFFRNPDWTLELLLQWQLLLRQRREQAKTSIDYQLHKKTLLEKDVRQIFFPQTKSCVCFWWVVSFVGCNYLEQKKGRNISPV